LEFWGRLILKIEDIYLFDKNHLIIPNSEYNKKSFICKGKPITGK